MLFHRYRFIVSMLLIVLSVPSIHAAQDLGSATGAGWLDRAAGYLPGWLGGVSTTPADEVLEAGRPDSTGNATTEEDAAADAPEVAASAAGAPLNYRQRMAQEQIEADDRLMCEAERLGLGVGRPAREGVDPVIFERRMKAWRVALRARVDAAKRSARAGDEGLGAAGGAGAASSTFSSVRELAQGHGAQAGGAGRPVRLDYRALNELNASLIVCAKAGDVVRIESLLRDVTDEDKAVAILTPNSSGETPFAWAATLNHIPAIKLFFSYLSPSQRARAVNHKRPSGDTVLIIVASPHGTGTIPALLEPLDATQRFDAICCCSGGNGDTALMRAVKGRQKASVRELFGALTSDQQEEALKRMYAVRLGEQLEGLLGR